MRRMKRTKIIATLGPASSDRAMIARLFEAGADVFRINMSHASHELMRSLVGMIRDVEREYSRPIAILVDLQGPKLRVGTFGAGPVDLPEGARFALDSDKKPGDATRVQLPHPEILRALRPGHTVLVDDGKVRLRVVEATPKRADQRRIAGTSAARLDLPDKLLGVPRYIHDMRLPGMLHARMVRPPSRGARLLDVSAPRVMGIGPVPATQKLFARLGMTQDQMDVIELNEAFAAQGLAVLRGLGIADDDARVNPNGGAIALGHPLGMSGARLIATATHEMQERGLKRALATMCIGVGQGIATVLERV